MWSGRGGAGRLLGPCGPATETLATAFNGSSSGLWAWGEGPRPHLEMGPLRLSLRCGYLLPE